MAERQTSPLSIELDLKIEHQSLPDVRFIVKDTAYPLEIPNLLRGEVKSIERWLRSGHPRASASPLVMILVGSALYGASIGLWRSPLQAGFAAIKFPSVVILTTLGTALLNGMLAPLLGLNIRFRESLGAILASFAIASLVLGALSPVAFFLAWNMVPLGEIPAEGSDVHAWVKLFHVGSIGLAGVAAHVRLWQLLQKLAGSRAVAFRVLGSWLATNLFLGSQLIWILRPFIGAPWLPVQFLRPDALRGSFFETVFHDVLQIYR